MLPFSGYVQVPDAVTVYRKVLAAQPDRSVAIASIGIHTNLAALLKSGPDEYSPLRGHDLVARKVVVLAVMGGVYPEATSFAECNVCGGGRNQHNALTASNASSYVAANWPSESKLIWSGFEVGVQVQSGGAGFQRCKVATVCKETPWTTACDPCAAAMISYENGPNKSRCDC